MTENTPPRSTTAAYIRGLLSLVLPGLGQASAGAWSRGVSLLAGVVVVGGLTVYTAAQRARFPDYGLSLSVFWRLLLALGGLFALLGLVYRLVHTKVLRGGFARSLAPVGLVATALVLLGLVNQPLQAWAIPADQTRALYGGTAVLGAAIVAALWLWGAVDAAQTTPGTVRPFTPFYLLLLIGVLGVGTTLLEIDLAKAIREYRDTERVLSRIFWPWQAAFDYEASTLEATAKIEAPCVDEAAAPAVNQPSDTTPWIVVTPTCGEPSVRDRKGHLTYGTLLTIRGGGFKPGLKLQLKWEDPIGNTFTPRGVGETEFLIGEDGTFETQLYIPDVTIPSLAQGAQIHTLHAIQRGANRFTGQLSREMQLALQAMLETILMGLLATFTGIVFSVPISFLAARNLMNPIHTSSQGFVGGVIGLAAGAWAGKWLAGEISALWGGLERAPIATAVLHFLFILGLGVLAFRLLASALDWLASHAPPGVARGITLGGFALIGGAAGYGLGVLFAKGVLTIPYGEAGLTYAPRTGLAGAVLLALAALSWALRMGEGDKVPIGRMVYTVTRLSLNIVRSIEPLIWAVMGVIWVGPGPFAGFIALTLHSIAALGKLYSEAIESINPGPIEALQATGANRLQTIVYAVIPQVMPPFTAFTLYRWDINVRMSTVIGLVGGGGIGFLLIQWIRQFQYLQAGLAVWLITITVAVLDFVSANIREKMV